MDRHQGMAVTRIRIGLLLIGAAYALAIVSPALTLEFLSERSGPLSLIQLTGRQILLSAPIAIFLPQFWANFALVYGLRSLTVGKPRRAFAAGLVATLLAAATVLGVMNELWFWLSGLQEFPLRPGYFLWLGCMLGLTVLAHLATSRSPASNVAPAGYYGVGF